jgi:hypothetical protein
MKSLAPVTVPILIGPTMEAATTAGLDLMLVGADFTPIPSVAAAKLSLSMTNARSVLAGTT